MKVSAFCCSLLTLFAARTAFSAGMELSGQSISALFEPGHYAEISMARLDADLSGMVDNQTELSRIGVSDFSTGNLVQNRNLANAALKFQIQPQISVGLFFDQPFGTKINYLYSPETVIGKLDIESANVHFSSRNISFLTAYQPTENWNFFAGLAYQTLKGQLEIGGQKYYILNGYQTELDEDAATGWLAGISYQIPDYALRASLSYRSAIKHNLAVQEQFPAISTEEKLNSNTHLQTPQSINLDVRTAVSTNNLLYSSFRWVNWKDFVLQPQNFDYIVQAYAQYDPEISSVKLIQYANNQLSAKLGFMHQWNEQWVTAHDISWDSGSGNPASTLNPADGYNGIGAAVIHRFSPETFAVIGLQYLKFRKARVKPDEQNTYLSSLSSVNNNHAIAYGFKIGHHF